MSNINDVKNCILNTLFVAIKNNDWGLIDDCLLWLKNIEIKTYNPTELKNIIDWFNGNENVMLPLKLK